MVKTIVIADVQLTVTFNYSYDPGVYTYSNGDPGYPPSEDFEITSIYCIGDLTKLLDKYDTSEKIYEEIEEIIIKDL